MFSSSELVNQISEAAQKLAEPQLFAEMDLPEGARLRKDGLITFKGLLVALSAISEEGVAGFTEAEGRRGAGVEIAAFPEVAVQVSRRRKIDSFSGASR